MAPTLRHGDQLLVWLADGRVPRRTGRLVLVRLPDRPLSVKRLVAVAADGRVRVEGDNPAGSTDSRQLGLLPSSSLAGVVITRLWPPLRRSGDESWPSGV
jgi:hypothetical protein